MSQDPYEIDCHPLSMGDKAEGWKVSIFLGVGETVRNEREAGFSNKAYKTTSTTVEFGSTPFNLYPGILTSKSEQNSSCAPFSSPKHHHLPARPRVKGTHLHLLQRAWMLPMPANFPWVSLAMNKSLLSPELGLSYCRTKQKAGWGGQQVLFLKHIWESAIKQRRGAGGREGPPKS